MEEVKEKEEEEKKKGKEKYVSLKWNKELNRGSSPGGQARTRRARESGSRKAGAPGGAGPGRPAAVSSFSRCPLPKLT